MPIATHEYEFVRDLVRARAGIVLEAGKEYLVESRLSPLMRREGFTGIDKMLDAMRSGPLALSLTQKVVEAMTTNETSFFRDLHPFEAFRDNVIPELVRRRATTRSISIWCAAASSGQEPYTIAMVLRENFSHLISAGWKFSIVATDISSEMIARCRAGKYSQLEINRGLPAPLLVKYFKKHGMEWEIDESLRKMVEYRELNLCADWIGLPAPDVVFMRNVLIYFSLDTKRQILGKVRRLMRPDGYLFLGGAETTINIDEGYDRIQVVKSGIYQIKNEVRNAA